MLRKSCLADYYHQQHSITAIVSCSTVIINVSCWKNKRLMTPVPPAAAPPAPAAKLVLLLLLLVKPPTLLVQSPNVPNLNQKH